MWGRKSHKKDVFIRIFCGLQIYIIIGWLRIILRKLWFLKLFKLSWIND
jgi:hypothetical protein